MTMTLDECLRNEYGRPSISTNRMGESQSAFQIDDRNENGDTPEFCTISAIVTDAGVVLDIRNLPLGNDVKQLLADGSAEVDDRHAITVVRLQVTVEDAEYLRRLAKEIKRLVGLGHFFLIVGEVVVFCLLQDVLDTRLAEVFDQRLELRHAPVSAEKREPAVPVISLGD